MKKRILLLSLTLILTFSGIVYASGVNGSYKGHNIVKVTLDGKELKPDDVPGQMIDGRTLIPLGLLRKAGFTVEWDQATLTANVKMPPPRTVPILLPSQLDELSKYVYKIQAPLKDNPGMAHQGSGFLVNGVMITNAHVWDESPNIQAQIDGKWQTGKVVFTNKDVDLMGFTVSGGKSLPISTELPQVGDPVYDLSYPGGTLSITEGKVYSVAPMDGVTTIAHSSKVDKGSSGGIVLNGRGEIIAVNQLGDTLPNGDYITFSIPISYVLDELNK